MIVISRPVGETTLNGKEYVLGDDNKKLEFPTEEAAVDFLRDSGYMEIDIEEQGIMFEEIDE